MRAALGSRQSTAGVGRMLAARGRQESPGSYPNRSPAGSGTVVIRISVLSEKGLFFSANLILIIYVINMVSHIRCCLFTIGSIFLYWLSLF